MTFVILSKTIFHILSELFAIQWILLAITDGGFWWPIQQWHSYVIRSSFDCHMDNIIGMIDRMESGSFRIVITFFHTRHFSLHTQFFFCNIFSWFNIPDSQQLPKFWLKREVLQPWKDREGIIVNTICIANT